MIERPGGSIRTQRVEREIRELLGFYLISKMAGDLKGLVTVAVVRVTRDLKLARVYVSILGSEDQKEFSLDAIKDRTKDLQKHLAHNLNVKFCPKLEFYLDETADEFRHVQDVLRQIRTEAGAADLVPIVAEPKISGAAVSLPATEN